MQIKAIKTFLLQNFMDSLAMSGRVHSVFEHAINLEVEETLITLLPDSDANIPDSVVLAYKDFALLKNVKAKENILVEDKKIKLGEFEINIANSSNFENKFSISELASNQEIENRKSQFGFYHTLPERAETKLASLLVAIKNKNQQECENILKTLIGLGSGLTPSADDALIGISAVIEFLTACGIDTFNCFADIVYKVSENRTTDVSRKYFRCACQKRYSLPLINVVRSLLQKNYTFDFPALAKLLNTGHSSGKDTMRGVVLACKTFLFSK